MIPFVDLTAQHEPLLDDLKEAAAGILASSHFILGESVEAFERAFADYIGCEYAVGVASGLDALKLSLRALDVGPGDEVITAANTYIATAFAISATGAKPVLVDVDAVAYTLNASEVERAITEKTKAIIPVHLYGQSVDMDPLLALAKARGLEVIEDASQAHGARYKGKRVGALGAAGAFSLYPGKNLGACGDGGVVVTDRAEVAERLKMLRNYGSSKKYVHEMVGENSRLDSLQAALLNVKLPKLDGWNRRRRELAQAYSNRLHGVGDIVLPAVKEDIEHVFHLYVIQTQKRDELLSYLQARNIGCLIHYPIPIHLQEAYANMGWVRGDFPVTESLAAQILSLPLYPSMDEGQVDVVVGAVDEFFKQA